MLNILAQIFGAGTICIFNMTLQEIINDSQNIVFFGGAGVSTESGIPDFRSVDGLYNLKYKFPPEYILSHTFFCENTKYFYEFYRDKMLYLDAKPNDCHKKLVELERAGKLKAVVTQNIDGLHQKAGSKVVYELHGSVHRNYCMKCKKFYDVNFILDSTDVPKCDCGEVVKPDVVLYEEGLDNDTIEKTLDAISKADCLIVAGTSLNVYPAASFIRYFRGKHFVLINRDSTSADNMADLIIRDNVGEVLNQIVV